MKPCHKSIPLPLPLHGAMLAAPGFDNTLDHRIRDRETASYRRGREEAGREAAVQLAQLRAEFAELQNGVLRSLANSVATVARDCEPVLIAVALETARKLIAGLPVNTALVEAAVREALAEIEDQTQLRVLLHPEDLALLEKAASPLLTTSVGGDRMRVEASTEVTRGGCIVQTRLGVVDARRESKFEMLQQAVQD